MSQYKLFIWELSDYNSGVMFAMAESVEQARELLKTTNPRNANYYRQELEGNPDHIWDQPAAYLLAGSG
jgi:hypothetical protein